MDWIKNNAGLFTLGIFLVAVLAYTETRLARLEGRLNTRIDRLETDLKANVQAVMVELKADMQALKIELKADIREIRNLLIAEKMGKKVAHN